MRILLTGASGLVGTEVARQAANAGHTVIGLVGRWAHAVPGTSELHSVDLTHAAVAVEWTSRIQPDVIINAAAISEPAACETDPVVSRNLNVMLPAALAEAAAATGAHFIHISSEQVFNGEKAPYHRDDSPTPINLYARQKVESEQLVLAASTGAAVVRAPLLLGNSLSGRRSVHEKLFELWSGGNSARLYADEFRQVCTAGNLATALLELASRPDLRGIFHWAGAQLCSRYELAQRIAAQFGVPSTLVASIHRAETPAISAKRPANLALNLAPLDRELRVKPQSLDDALRELVVPVHFRDWQSGLNPSSRT
jgi:dTDP-4-dehydrorhamnose reductase